MDISTSSNNHRKEDIWDFGKVSRESEYSYGTVCFFNSLTITQTWTCRHKHLVSNIFPYPLESLGGGGTLIWSRIKYYDEGS